MSVSHSVQPVREGKAVRASVGPAQTMEIYFIDLLRFSAQLSGEEVKIA
jgi:hypothetical protein